MKTAITITIEKEYLDKINLSIDEGKYKSLSDAVNTMIQKSLETLDDPFVLLPIVLREYEDKKKEIIKIYEDIDNLKIEGMKKDRDKAERLLEEKKKKEQEYLQKLTDMATSLRTSNHFADFLEFVKNNDVDYNNLSDWAGKFQLEGIKISSYYMKKIIEEGLLNGE